MYHMAWEMPSFEALQQLHARLLSNGVHITGYSPRQVNVMFLDPDGNELEALWEPSEEELRHFEAAGQGLPRLNPDAS
jgi:catechol-2,3-dioxygenase